MKKRWNDIKIIGLRFILIVIPLVIFSVVGINYIVNMEVDSVKTFINSEQQLKNNVFKYIIDDVINEATSDLFTISNSYVLHNYFEYPSTENLNKLNQLFVRKSKNRPQFDQIRFINVDGMEIARVNNHVDEMIVNQEDLQDKSNRYYFSETINLPEGTVYMSPFDLNIENGEVEKPYKPMLRFATPVYYNNQLQGIIIMNYLGENVISIFEESEMLESDYFKKPILINREGYYLSDGEEIKTFGFMFDEHQQETLSIIEPELYNEIINNEEKDGSLEIENIMYYYSKIGFSESTHPINVSDDYYWLAISSFDTNTLTILNTTNLVNKNWAVAILSLINSLVVLIIISIHYYLSKNKKHIAQADKIMEKITDATLVLDSNKKVKAVNNKFANFVNMSVQECIGKDIYSFDNYTIDAKRPDNIWEILDKKGECTYNFWYKSSNGMLSPQTVSISLLPKDKNQDVSYLYVISNNITMLREEANLNVYNENNLANGKLLVKLMNDSLSEGNKFAVIYVSINNYNRLITEHSKDIYNKMVQKFIGENMIALRMVDYVAQLSESHFILVVKSADSRIKAKRYVQLLAEKFAPPIIVENFSLKIDAKMGVAFYPDDGNESQELIKRAAIAMEMATNDKGSKYFFFKKAFQEKFEREIGIEKHLKEAISLKQFTMAYQPQIDLKSNEVIGAEALIRWNSPDLGFVSPSEFIPITENNGMIIEIGKLVIDQTIADTAKLVKEHDFKGRMSINISPVQFFDDRLLPYLLVKLEEFRLSSSYICLEITENIFIKDIEKIEQRLAEIRSIGLTLAIDDFGTGFSSLSYIKSLTIDIIKIDRDFVLNYPMSDNGTMAKIINDIGKRLRLEVIAEGIESKEQANFLQDIGCYTGQGYYYSKPVDYDSFVEFLKKT